MGITISASIYTVVSLVYYLFIPFDILTQNSETIGAEFFEITIGPIAGTYIVPIFVGVSMWITCTCNIFVFGRSLEAIARESLFPYQNQLQKRNRYNMPYFAASVTTFVAILYTIGMPAGNGLNFLIDAASYPHWISTGTVIGMLIYIRLVYPEIISPYTSWLPCLLTFFFGAVFVVVFPMLQNTNSTGYDSRYPFLVMIGVIIIGFGIYLKIRGTVLIYAFLVQDDSSKRVSKFV